MFSFCSSVWKTKIKLFVKGSWSGFPLFSPFDRMKKCGLSYFAPGWWVLIKIVFIIQGFKRLTSFVFLFWLPEMLIENQSAPHTFLQKKKGKKRKPSFLVEGFKKASFFWFFFSCLIVSFCRVYSKKKIQITGTAWTCFFEYLEQTFGFFFILFFVKMFLNCLLERGRHQRVWLIVSD